MKPVHAFTVDVEEWFDGIPVPAETKAGAERRLERGLVPLLELLARHGVRGTFFWLGPAAEAYPGLLAETVAGGHEIGCHGWSHELIYRMTPERFRAETRRAMDAIGQRTGQAPRAYRAAYFSVTAASLWALEVLAELGFERDSSIFPTRNWRYGIPDFDPRPQTIETPAGALRELPMSVRRVAGRSIPAAGGAYLRIYPLAVTRSNFRALERESRPVNFYIHPWELDPGHPRARFHWRARATHYVNLRATAPRLEALLSEFRFGPLTEVFAA